MSQRALVLAVRDRLQFLFNWSDDVCNVTPFGQPRPDAGELFVAVTEGGYKNRETESLDEIHAVRIIVTRRISVAPMDRTAEETIHKAIQGADMVAEGIKSKLHSDPDKYAVVNAANAYILEQAPSGSTVYGFSVPLFLSDVSPPQPRDSSWFYSAGDTVDQWAGVSITMTLDGAERLQPIQFQ